MTNSIEEQVGNTTSKIGKFNTADDLFAAYNALEREFTKRCQLIKELQTELENRRAQAENVGSADDRAVTGEQPPVPPEQTHTDDISANEQAIDTDGNKCRKRAEECEPYAVSSDVVALNCGDDVSNEILRCARDYAETLSAIPEIMDACIFKYKQKLMDARMRAVAPSGMAVIVPAKRPRTLADAKRLADDMLK